jgi:hypothetical protein
MSNEPSDAERILTAHLPGDITPEEIEMMTWLLERLGCNGRN